MKEMVRLNFALSFDHAEENLLSAMGIKKDRFEFLKDRLANTFKRTEQLTGYLQQVLVDKELSGAEKVFGLTQMESLVKAWLLAKAMSAAAGGKFEGHCEGCEKDE